jgi:ubiquinol-cytochrome c reductase core subunit 2
LEGDTVTRTILDAELRGNSLYSSVGREHVLLGSEFLRDDVVDVVPTLVQNVFNQKFEPYEFVDAAEETYEQSLSASSDPQAAVLDKLHQVAFRRGLGNAFFPSAESLKSLSRKNLKEFASTLNAEKIAIVGTGINHGDLKTLVEEALANVKLPSGVSEKDASKYYGGEARIAGGPNSEAVYAVAYPGPSLTSADYYASLVLKELVDGTARVKWGTPSNGTETTVAEGFAAHYSDNGLLGFVVKGNATEVKKVAQQAIASLKQAATGLTTEQLESAKSAAVLALESQLNRQNLVEALGVEAVLNANTSSVEALQKVSTAEVQKVQTH